MKRAAARRPAAALALVLLGALLPAAAPTALAGDEGPIVRALLESCDRYATVEYAPRDEALRDDCSRRISAWWDEILAPGQPAPAGWDEKKLGPWSLVARTSGGGYVEERPGFVHVIVTVAAEGLPSRADAADALIRHVLTSFEARVNERARLMSADALSPAEAELTDAQQFLQVVRTDVVAIEKEHGGPPARRAASLADRLAETERAASQTRIDRAVSAKKLDAARKAAERATELERLRRDAVDLERRVEEMKRSSEGGTELALKLAALRTRVEDLAKSTPSLDTARETVFHLEVDLVGFEARSAVLAEEVAALRDECAKAQADVRRHAPLARSLDAAQSRLDDAEAIVRQIRARRNARGPVFQVIRAPGPPPKRQEEKR